MEVIPIQVSKLFILVLSTIILPDNILSSQSVYAGGWHWLVIYWWLAGVSQLKGSQKMMQVAVEREVA